MVERTPLIHFSRPVGGSAQGQVPTCSDFPYAFLALDTRDLHCRNQGRYQGYAADAHPAAYDAYGVGVVFAALVAAR